MLPPELMELVKSGGSVLAPIFAILWYMERKDKQDALSKLETITERVIVAMTETKTTLQTFSSLLSSGRKPS